MDKNVSMFRYVYAIVKKKCTTKTFAMNYGNLHSKRVKLLPLSHDDVDKIKIQKKEIKNKTQTGQ